MKFSVVFIFWLLYALLQAICLIFVIATSQGGLLIAIFAINLLSGISWAVRSYKKARKSQQ